MKKRIKNKYINIIKNIFLLGLITSIFLVLLNLSIKLNEEDILIKNLINNI